MMPTVARKLKRCKWRRKKRRRSVVGLMLQHIPFKLTGALGSMLDAHRKARQALHPELTLTGMYNVLEKLRAGEPLTLKEQVIHEQGQVSVLKQIHDDLDAAVFACYGWPVTLSDEEILERMVALNAERAAEEKRGLIRWLRPEYQNPGGVNDVKPIEVDEPAAQEAPKKKVVEPWPRMITAQVQAVRQRLNEAERPVSAIDVASGFTKGNAVVVSEILQALETIGRARRIDAIRYVAG